MPSDVNQLLFLLGVVMDVSCETRLLLPNSSVSQPCHFIHFSVVAFQVLVFWIIIIVSLTDVLICMKFHKRSASFLCAQFHKRMCITLTVLIGEYLGHQGVLELENLGGWEKMRMLKS